MQLVAANIDTAFVVTSCNRDFNIARLERYVALAFEAGIEPVPRVVRRCALTNALAGTQAMTTQAIREDDARGRHTTTRRELHPMPGGCLVLDTPGMRELQLTDAASGIADVFEDTEALSAQCRFGDCRHETEPACAVRVAVEENRLDPARLARWRKLQEENTFNSASLDERRAKDRAFGKMVRRVMKEAKSRHLP